MRGGSELLLKIAGESPMSGTTTYGLPSPQNPSPTAGFTAVNGNNANISPQTPTDTIVLSSPVPAKDNSETNGVPRRDKDHHVLAKDARIRLENGVGNRHKDAITGEKRKRSDSHDRRPSHDIHLDTRGPIATDRGSPDHRYALTVADSAIDLTSPNDGTNGIQLHLPSERNSPSAQEREPSPVPRRNQTQPPPRPRPETEASLAQSVLKFQLDQQASENRQSQVTSTDKAASPEEGQDDDDGPDQDDVPSQGDGHDPWKKKRNFSKRTKTGCHTCRQRKKKCDERKPICNNCESGGHFCYGYGPKQAVQKNQMQIRAIAPLQQKASAFDRMVPPAPGPQAPGYWPHFPPLAPQAPANEAPYNTWPGGFVDHGQPRDHYESTPSLPPPPPPPPLPQPSAHVGGENWPRSHYSYSDPPPPGQAPPPYPMEPPAPSLSSFYPTPQPSHPPDRRPPEPIHPPTFDTYPSYLHNRPASNLGTGASRASGGSGTPPSSWRFPGACRQPNAAKRLEKDKMLTGKSYKHYLDDLLSRERVDCYKRLSKYNRAAEDLHPDEAHKTDRAKVMQGITNPNIDNPLVPHYGPIGLIRETTVIEAPFLCDYGYHLHIGKETAIERGCQFQDAGGIYIGDRVVIGPKVIITTMMPDTKSPIPNGNQGLFKAGMVKIEDDVFIGAGAIILPYVTIGKGARVAAGAVVTTDVKENWTVAGNPAKRIHENDELKPHKKARIKEMEEMASKMNWTAGWGPTKDAYRMDSAFGAPSGPLMPLSK